MSDQLPISEVRDRIAELRGWRKLHPDNPDTRWKRDTEPRTSFSHPCPTALDGIAALIKQAGYRWYRGMHHGSWMWHAAKPRQPIMDGPRVPDTDNEVDDLTRLLYAVLLSQKEQP